MAGKLIKYPRRSRRINARKLLVLVFLLCIVTGVILYVGQTWVYFSARGELNDLQAELESVRAENESLREEIELLQDEEYLEMQARRHLGMVRPGEVIFTVVE